jgi:AP-4 complex subunit beta-1
MAEQTQGAGLFMDYKLGEANEIKAALRELSSNKAGEARQKRDIIQKVVGYMTLGLDMSSVFMEILMQAQTRDVVQKKLIYLYLVGYSTIDPQKTMMAISTLQKDCFDDDPVIRGLALRSLCSVRVQDLTEYVVDPLKKGLADSTPYVRKTAVMGCLKLYITSPETAKSFRVNEQLLNMVRDRDPQVVANCMYVLNEIFISQGGLTLDHKTIVHLLNRMRDFNDWAQCMLLEVVSRHEPKDQGELIDIMNLLETRLRSTNCGVILAITKVFLHLTVDIPKLHKQVFSRLRAPIITHMVSAGPELAYSCLQHILLLVNRNPEVFHPEYKRFFLRVNDPAYTKKIKLDILVELVTPESVADIIQEIQFNTMDLDENVSKHAVAKVGDVASKLEPAERGAVFARLVGMLEKSSSAVLNAAIVAIVTSLRKYPDTATEVVPALELLICQQHADLVTVDARVSALFVLGEFGNSWPDAPYVLEDMCEDFATEPSPLVRLQMLNTTARTFFKRPAEVKKLLATLLKESIEEDDEDDGTADGPKPGDSQDVRDRALLYYRLLQGKIQVAYGVICAQRQPIEKYAEEDSEDLKEIVFKEFNTLSVVYNKPAESFLLPYPEPGILFEEEEEEEEEEAAAEGGEGGAAEVAAAPVEVPPPQINPAAAKIDQKKFGGTWSTVGGQKTTCQAGGPADYVLSKLAPMGFQPLAKGNTPDGGAKVYVYCGFSDGMYGYIEMIISPTGAVSATVKCDGDDAHKTGFLIQNLRAAIAY